MCRRIPDPEMGLCHSRVRWDIDHKLQPNLKSACGVGGSANCGAISIEGMSVFVPGLMELHMFGVMYDPGMGPSRSWMRRDLDVVLRGNSCQALAP